MQKSGNIEVEALLYDISPDGVQIRCDKNTAGIICPKGKITKDDMLQHMQAIFELPHQKEKKTICIEVIPVYLIFISRDLLALGMQFKTHEKEMLKIIDDFIDGELTPNIGELEEILKEKIDIISPYVIDAHNKKFKNLKKQIKKEKDKSKKPKFKQEDAPKYDLARIDKDIQEIRKYCDILGKVTNKLAVKLEDIETLLQLKKRKK
jgi:hypothetical protein